MSDRNRVPGRGVGRITVLLLIFILVPGLMTFLWAYAGPETCAGCHEKEHQEWKNSIHAKALSETFNKAWKKIGANPECLACHTTGHKKGSKEYAFAGVTCESCHGELKEGHPETKMGLPVEASACAPCHANTYREWKLSKHGQKNIRCFDCHNVHSQGLRSQNTEALCGSCHSERLRSFAHATHHQRGLTCATCHFPRKNDSMEAIEGTGAAAHNLAVGAEVCARCHSEMVHRSHRLPSLRDEVSVLQGLVKETQAGDAERLKEENEDLQWKLKGLRRKSLFLEIAAFFAGVIAGIFAIRRFKAKGPGRNGS